MAAAVSTLASGPVAAASAAGAGGAGAVRIVRDEYGVPHVYAQTPRALFYGDGYASAQDRLWQADLSRRTATGTLSELLGAGSDEQNVYSDLFFRGYTGGQAFLDAAVDALAPADRSAVSGFVAGVNGWIAVATRTGALPPEYAANGQLPRPWTASDVLATGMLQMSEFGAQGGSDELGNTQTLRDMTARLGPVEAAKAFTDTHWLDDPSAPTTIPSTPTTAPPAPSAADGARPVDGAGPVGPVVDPSGAVSPPPAAVDRVRRQWDAARAVTDALGLGGVGHSNSIAVSGRLSANGFPLLLGGPQIPRTLPQGFLEIGLHGAGYDVTGVALAGSPGVQIGVAGGHAWTVTSGGDDNQDIYLHSLDPAGHPGQYPYDGGWRPFDCRPETIQVAAAPPVTTTLCQDVHGPVLDITGESAVALRDATRDRAERWIPAFLALDRARDLPQFLAAGRTLNGSFNLTYADHAGHIAYTHVGPVPLRPVTDNPFLPHPGDGSDEWQGLLAADRMPLVIDPAQGWLANWNNKPVSGWRNAVNGFCQWGPVTRSQVLDDELRRIRPHTATITTLQDINRTAGQTTETPVADDSSVLVQRLLPALRRHLQLSADPRLAPVAAALTTWDRQRVDDNGDGRYDNPAVTIFNTWYTTFAADYLASVLGPDYLPGRGLEHVTANVALRLLQGDRAALPLTLDYLHDRPLESAVTGSLITALDHLTTQYGTPDPAAWLTPAVTVEWTPLGAGTGPATPQMNRGTYNQIIALGPDVHGENVVAPGQSGDPRSPHFTDQLALYTAWRYKPMHLTRHDINRHTASVDTLTVPDPTGTDR